MNEITLTDLSVYIRLNYKDNNELVMNKVEKITVKLAENFIAGYNTLYSRSFAGNKNNAIEKMIDCIGEGRRNASRSMVD